MTFKKNSVQIIGSYNDLLDEQYDLNIELHSGDNLTWSHCGLTADYVAQFYSKILPTENPTSNEIFHTINYIANELLENAFKFKSDGHIVLQSIIDHRASSKLTLIISNQININQVDPLIEQLSILINSDVEQLMLEKLEANAISDDDSTSCLGFITMINDYDASLGWKISGNENEKITISIMAQISIDNFGTKK
ncbi:MAG: hypothetical protein HON94_11605 [Methylococcales bacterium]|jgi:hypothetical protein|nr:hypothetical protein [Methylococcales bacterium]MBT7408316.1 hypothetical protein [Methylococcales bacterium]